MATGKAAVRRLSVAFSVDRFGSTITYAPLPLLRSLCKLNSTTFPSLCVNWCIRRRFPTGKIRLHGALLRSTSSSIEEHDTARDGVLNHTIAPVTNVVWFICPICALCRGYIVTEIWISLLLWMQANQAPACQIIWCLLFCCQSVPLHLPTKCIHGMYSKVHCFYKCTAE